MRKLFVLSAIFVIFVTVAGFIFASVTDNTSSVKTSSSINPCVTNVKAIDFTKNELTLDSKVARVEITSFRTVPANTYPVAISNGKVIVDNYLSQINFYDKIGNQLSSFSLQ